MLKVLVVDDDPDVLALITVWLRGSDYHVVRGADGYQAVQLALAEQPDVIVLDINMPAARGFAVQENLKGIPRVASVPIIYISADRMAESQAMAAGAARFLSKPLRKESVLRTLREVCGRRDDPSSPMT